MPDKHTHTHTHTHTRAPSGGMKTIFTYTMHTHAHTYTHTAHALDAHGPHTHTHTHTNLHYGPFRGREDNLSRHWISKHLLTRGRLNNLHPLIPGGRGETLDTYQGTAVVSIHITQRPELIQDVFLSPPLSQL